MGLPFHNPCHDLTLHPLICLYILLLPLLLLPSPACTRDVVRQRESYTPDYARHYHNLTAVIRQASTGFIESHASLIVGSLPLWVLRLLQRLQENRSSTPPRVGDWLLANFELTLVPLANPDGRQHLEVTKNYCWRGTSTGVDMNRNFDFDFGGQGSSGDPKDEEFRGPFAASEPETRALVQLAQESVYDVYLSLHSGARQLYIPFSDARSISTGRSPPFAKHMERVAAAAVAKHNSQSKDTFTAGPAQQLLEYPASGTAFDFMAGARRIPLAFALELYGEGVEREGGCFQLFNPPSAELADAVDTAETMLAS